MSNSWMEQRPFNTETTRVNSKVGLLIRHGMKFNHGVEPDPERLGALGLGLVLRGGDDRGDKLVKGHVGFVLVVRFAVSNFIFGTPFGPWSGHSPGRFQTQGSS